jgi:hypothetical protein
MIVKKMPLPERILLED